MDNKPIPWVLVPDDAMVAYSLSGKRMYAVQHNGRGWWVGSDAWSSFNHARAWRWGEEPPGEPKERPIIVARGLKGNESAAELRKLADAFEVQE